MELLRIKSKEPRLRKVYTPQTDIVEPVQIKQKRAWKILLLIGLKAPTHTPSVRKVRPRPNELEERTIQPRGQVAPDAAQSSADQVTRRSNEEEPGSSSNPESSTRPPVLGEISEEGRNRNEVPNAQTCDNRKDINPSNSTPSVPDVTAAPPVPSASEISTVPQISIAPDVSIVPRVSTVPDPIIYQFEKDVFISPGMVIAAEDREAWKHIGSRLIDTLEHLLKPQSGMNPVVEFMMAGRSSTQLRPSIMIICYSKPHKAEIKKIVKTQKWIATHNYPCLVLVDPIRKLSALKARDNVQTPYRTPIANTSIAADYRGAIIGGVVGGIVVIVLLFTALDWLFRKAKKQQYKTPTGPELQESGDPELPLDWLPPTTTGPPSSFATPSQKSPEISPYPSLFFANRDHEWKSSQDPALHHSQPLVGVLNTDLIERPSTVLRNQLQKASEATSALASGTITPEAHLPYAHPTYAQPPYTQLPYAHLPYHYDTIDVLTIDVLTITHPSDSTLCGTLAGSYLGLRLAKFTIGGVIIIDNKFYGLTTGHNLYQEDDSSGFSASASKTSEASHDDSSSAYISFDDESTKALPDSVPSPVAASSKEFVKLTSQMLLENSSATKSDISPSRRKIYKSERLGYINAKRRLPVVISGRNPQLDWEVIELSDSSPWLTNSILPAGRSEPSMLTSIMKSTDFQDGEVTIIAGSSGLTKGWLRSCPAYMQFESASFEAFQILLDKPLARGDSGSWVIQNGKVCGHILAGRTIALLAYMLPIETIFDDIKRHRNVKNVGLSVPEADDTVKRFHDSTQVVTIRRDITI